MASMKKMSTRNIANMSKEEVDKLVAIAAMEAGVANPGPEPNFTASDYSDYGAVPPPTVDAYDVNGAIFETREAAEKFIQLQPLTKRFSWDCGYSRFYLEPISPECLTIRIIQAYEQEEYIKVTPILQAMQKEESAYEEKLRAWQEAKKAWDKVAVAIYDDWYSAKKKMDESRAIIRRYKEYLLLTGGNSSLALKFLALVHVIDEIKEAWDNVGLEFSGVPEPVFTNNATNETTKGEAE